MNCPICKSKKNKIIWNGKLRAGKDIWTKEKRKASKCNRCEIIFLNRRSNKLIDNQIFRKKFDGDNSISKYFSFNKSREKFKLDKIKKHINFKNKIILESNCGAATNLDIIKKEAKITVGLDSLIYKDHVNKKHLFFSSIDELKSSKLKFDIILSLSEIEHQYDVKKFISHLKSKLKKNGYLVFRIPNYNNIYLHLLGEKFLKYDFRTSHNYYFSEKSCDYLFKKLKLKTLVKEGLQEYSINHLIEYLKTGKRVKKYPNLINKKISNEVSDNLGNYMVSTSLLYILKT